MTGSSAPLRGLGAMSRYLDSTLDSSIPSEFHIRGEGNQEAFHGRVAAGVGKNRENGEFARYFSNSVRSRLCVRDLPAPARRQAILAGVTTTSSSGGDAQGRRPIALGLVARAAPGGKRSACALPFLRPSASRSSSAMSPLRR